MIDLNEQKEAEDLEKKIEEGVTRDLLGASGAIGAEKGVDLSGIVASMGALGNIGLLLHIVSRLAAVERKLDRVLKRTGKKK